MSDRFIDNEGGTLTDTATGLTWTKNTFGDELTAAILPKSKCTWYHLTERFGRARPLRGGISFRERTLPQTQLTSESYTDFTFGSETVDFGDFDDWRLPTAEEMWSLVETKDDPIGSVGKSSSLATTALQDCDWLWTSNYYGWLSGLEAAWVFAGGNNSTNCDVIGDISPGCAYRFRLVRGGTTFERLTFPSKAFRKRNHTTEHFLTWPCAFAGMKSRIFTRYGIEGAEIYARTIDIFGRSRGHQPRMPITEEIISADVNGGAVRDLCCGDVIFYDRTQRPLVWKNAWNPERVRVKALAVIERIRAARATIARNVNNPKRRLDG